MLGSVLAALWWLCFGGLLGWVAWFSYDKWYLRGGSGETTGGEGVSGLEAQLAEVQAEADAYNAELTRTAEELEAATAEVQALKERVAQLEANQSRGDRGRGQQPGARPALVKSQAGADESEEETRPARRGPQARNAVAARSAGEAAGQSTAQPLRGVHPPLIMPGPLLPPDRGLMGLKPAAPVQGTPSSSAEKPQTAPALSVPPVTLAKN